MGFKGADELEDSCPEEVHGKTMESEYDKALLSELKSNGETFCPNFFSTVPPPPDSERRVERCVNDFLADENGEIHNRSESDKARTKTPPGLLIGLGLQKGPLIEPTHDHEDQPTVEAKEKLFTKLANFKLVGNSTSLKLAEPASFAEDAALLASQSLNYRLADGDEVETKFNRLGAAVRFASTWGHEAMLEKVLEHRRYNDREAVKLFESPGVSIGLVCTANGGTIQIVEANATVGKSKITGKLGDDIKESADVAWTWVTTRVVDLKLAAAEEIRLRDIHIHFPPGAVPKDGPSAGVTLATVLVSLISQKRVRKDTAMTGEITLMGLVLPVGGIKDKILAAYDNGIKRVIIPQGNMKDLVEVPPIVIQSLEILPAKRIEDVLEQAFEPTKKGSCDTLSSVYGQYGFPPPDPLVRFMDENNNVQTVRIEPCKTASFPEDVNNVPREGVNLLFQLLEGSKNLIVTQAHKSTQKVKGLMRRVHERDIEIENLRERLGEFEEGLSMRVRTFHDTVANSYLAHSKNNIQRRGMRE